MSGGLSDAAETGRIADDARPGDVLVNCGGGLWPEGEPVLRAVVLACGCPDFCAGLDFGILQVERDGERLSAFGPLHAVGRAGQGRRGSGRRFLGGGSRSRVAALRRNALGAACRWRWGDVEDRRARTRGSKGGGGASVT